MKSGVNRKLFSNLVVLITAFDGEKFIRSLASSAKFIKTAIATPGLA
jgi:hypothetical protein